MANLRTKYRDHNNQLIDLDLSVGAENPIKNVSGSFGNDASEIRVIPYNEYARTQDLLNIVADLIANDVALNAQASSTTFLLSEGVFTNGNKFAKNELDEYRVRLKGGSLKVGEGVYTATQEEELSLIKNLVHPNYNADAIHIDDIVLNNYYRMDYILFNYNPSSALEYVKGIETGYIPPVATQLDKSKSNINGSSAYVLYSMLLHKRNFYSDILKMDTLNAFKNVFEEETIQDVVLFNNEIYILRIDALLKLKLYKYNTAGISINSGSMPNLDTHEFANAKMHIDADGVWIQARWLNSTSTFGRVVIKFTNNLTYDGHLDEDDAAVASGIPTGTGFALSASSRAKTITSDITHIFLATKAIDGGLQDSIGIMKIAKSNWTAGSYSNLTPPVYALETYAADVADNFCFFEGDTTLGEKYAYLITSKDLDPTIHFRQVKLSDLSVVSGPDKIHATADGTLTFKNFVGMYYESGLNKELRYAFTYKTIGGPEIRIAIGKIGIDFPAPVINEDLVVIDTVDFTGPEMLSPMIIINNGSTIVSTITENIEGTNNISQDFSAPLVRDDFETGLLGTIKGVSFDYDAESNNGFYVYAREDAPTNTIVINRVNSVSNTVDLTKILSLNGTVQFSNPKISANSANVYVAFSIVDYQVTSVNTNSGTISATPNIGSSSIIVVRLDKSLNIIEYKILYNATKAFDNITFKTDERFIVVAASNSGAPEIECTKLRLTLSFAPLAVFTITPTSIITDELLVEFNRDFIYVGYLDSGSAKIVRMNIILVNALSNITLAGTINKFESIDAYFNELFVTVIDSTNNSKIIRLSQVLTSELQSKIVQTSMERASTFIKNRFIYVQSVDATGGDQHFDKYDLSFNLQSTVLVTPTFDANFSDSRMAFKANGTHAQVVGINTDMISGYRVPFNATSDSKIIYLVKPEVSGGVFFTKEISPYGITYDQKNAFIVSDNTNIFIVARDYNYSLGNKSELIYTYNFETREFETVIDNIAPVWKYTGLVNVVSFLKGYMKPVLRPELGLTTSLFEIKTNRYEHLCDKDGNLLDWLDAQSAGGTSTVGAKFDASDGNNSNVPLVDGDINLNGFDSLLSADYLGGNFINDFSVIPFSLNAISNLASIGIESVTMRKVEVQILGVPMAPYAEGMAAAFFEYPEFLIGDVVYDGPATLGILSAELELPGDITGTQLINDNTSGVIAIGDIISVSEGSGKSQTARIEAISYDSGNDKTIIQLSGLTKKIGNVEVNPGSSKLRFFKNTPTQIGLENFISVGVMQNQLDSQGGTYRTVEINFPTNGLGAAILNTNKYYFLKLRAYDDILNDPIDNPPRIRVVNPVSDINVTNRSCFYVLSYVQPPGSYPTNVQLFDDFEDITVANSDRLSATAIDDYFISSRALDDSSLREIDTNDMSDNQCFFDVHTGRVLFKPGFQPTNVYCDYHALNVVNGNLTADDIKVINIPGVDEVTLADKLIAGNI